MSAADRKQSRLRLPSASCEDIIGAGCTYNHTPSSRGRRASDRHDIETNIDGNKTDGDDNNNNNRSASAYLSKLLDCKDLIVDLDASPSPGNSELELNGFSYNSPKPSGSSSNFRNSIQRSTSMTQKRQSRILNRHKPAEIFRKDLISAMKIPDTSQLLNEEYWIMQDPWRIEWEKGVQVPVNAKSIPKKNIQIVPKETLGDFRMPRKMLKSCPDIGDKDMIDLNVLADSMCRYDLDEMDVAWLKIINRERKMMGLPFLDEFSMEQIMEELETQCHDNMQLAMQTKEGLGIEYDEDVVCDVCRMPDCEEGNEMVFCDGCNLCVHQACYGILKVPVGSWLCKLCALGIRGSAVCILCNKKGGAMKSTRSGNKWAHVSCALWIPEITIADPDRMEPITKISHVPASRWALLCSICKERVGACIQCSVRHCVTAYHVTCAIEDKLDMNADCAASPSEGQDDAVIFRSYCKKHSAKRKDTDDEDEGSDERMRGMRQKRILELEQQFYTLVKYQAVSNALSIPTQTAQDVMEYWKLKRTANFNRPLITPKNEEDTALAEAAESNLQRRLRMFTHLRQDLERVRNLCYMIGRREKEKRSSVRNMESVFLTQMKYLERCMCRDGKLDPQKIVRTLPKFGQPEVCELARKESIILATTPEWTQPVEKSKQTADQHETNAKTDVFLQNNKAEFSEKIKVHEKIENHDVKEMPVISSLRHKNGLQRKAFLTACRKHESLAPRKNVADIKPSPGEEKAEESVDKGGRKRLMDTDSEGQVTKPPIKKSQRAKAWTTWRATGAAASPSAFTIKTEKELTPNGKKDSTLDKKRVKVSLSPKDVSETLCKNYQTPELPSRITRQSRLVVKWDSDKTDDPEIMHKSLEDLKQNKTINIRPGKSRTVSASSEGLSESGKARESPKPTPRSRTITRSSKSLDNSTSSPSRPPLRQSALKAKNDSGALALSCDKEAEQGLQKPIQEEEQENIELQKLDSIERNEDEDVGYRGDMDESDVEVISTPCGRHKQTHTGHKRPHRFNIKTSDTADSSDFSTRTMNKNFPTKRKRLKSIQRSRGEPVKTGLLFKGFKDPIEGAPRARTRSQTDTSDSNRPKNAGAVDDICDNSAAPNDIIVTTIVGGHSGNLVLPSPHSSLPASTSSTPLPSHPDVKQEFYLPMDPFHNAIMKSPNFYPKIMPPAYPFVNPQDFYYSSIAQYQSHPMWSILTDEQKLKITQQLTENIFPQSYPITETIPIYKSPLQPMPDSTLSPESQPAMPPFCQIPENTEQMATPKSSNEPVPQPIDNAQESFPSTQNTFENLRSDAVTKKSKKKKKKKSKKKKKKRKRHNSDTYESSSSFSNGSYGEFCVEYCSTLDPLVMPPSIAQPIPEQVELQVLPTSYKTAPVLTLPAESLLEPTGATKLNFPTTEHSPQTIKTANLMEPMETMTQAQHRENLQPSSKSLQNETEESNNSKLLLKIDKKRLVLSQSSDLDDNDFSDEHSSTILRQGSDHFNKNEKLFVTPLKLKLSATKSDRTLRNGLMPCEYQILEDENEKLHPPPSSGKPKAPETTLAPVLPQNQHVEQVNADQPKIKVVRPKKSGYAALRRLGVTSGTIEIRNEQEKRTLRNRENTNKTEDTNSVANAPAKKEQITDSKPITLTGQNNPTPGKRKRGRPKKSLTPATTKPPCTANSNSNIDAYISISMANTNSTNLCSSSVQDRLGSLFEKQNNETRVKSYSTDSTKPSGFHVNLAPERHWKKRKVHEHETSVTTEVRTVTQPEDSLPSPPLSSENQSLDGDRSSGKSRENSSNPPTLTTSSNPNNLVDIHESVRGEEKFLPLVEKGSLSKSSALAGVSSNKFSLPGQKAELSKSSSTQNVQSSRSFKPEIKSKTTFSGPIEQSTVDVYEFPDFGS